MNKKEILRILDEHADKNYGDIYVSQHQEIAKDLLKYFKKQLLIQRVSQRSELLLCGVCDEYRNHLIINDKDTKCLHCGHVAKP